MHPFDRLVSWAESMAETVPTASWFVQHGHSRPPAGLRGDAFVSHHEMHALLDRAVAIVCHGGPSIILEAHRLGLTPLVVPRDPEFGEHVDDHQIRFARRLGEQGVVRVVVSLEELREHISGIISGPRERSRNGHAEDDQTRGTAMRFGAIVEARLRART
jgi:UDP-N-acetylglucosamine transferase subunit ALG13